MSNVVEMPDLAERRHRLKLEWIVEADKMFTGLSAWLEADEALAPFREDWWEFLGRWRESSCPSPRGLDWPAIWRRFEIEVLEHSDVYQASHYLAMQRMRKDEA